ncbi:MAG: ABC transporter permease subunit [Anaerolineae bacterium]|jgi:ABC-type branched-subunit amino acid transport system permease subunit
MVGVRSGLKSGLVSGIVNVFVVLLGLPVLVGDLTASWFSLSSQWPGVWFLLLAVAWWGGARAVRGAGLSAWKNVPLVGLLAGLTHGLVLGGLIGVLASLTAGGSDVRQVLAQISPEAMSLLTFDLSPILAVLLALGLVTAAGLLSALLTYASARYRWGESMAGAWQSVQKGIQMLPPVRYMQRFAYAQLIVYAIGLGILLAIPFFAGQYWNYTLGTVGLYVVLGLGLNIVVGMAGLLHLGYAAFFAIGGYTVAILTAPQFGIEWSFWAALPIGIVLAAFMGVLLSIPVLRMRGDYLAIVTLGFGEIIRILAKSDALTDFTGGPRGVRAVAGPALFGIDISSEFHFLYIILLGIVLVAFISSRLQNSRLGRAFMAMREDEDVAQTMGVYTLKYKVLAFAIGAAFAGLGGAIFASRNQFTGPEDYTLLVSVNVLSLVIIGGMNSLPGVILGSLVLKGLPEILRELDDYRMLAFGALLIVMMILRPEGLWPSKRRAMELREAADQEVSSL